MDPDNTDLLYRHPADDRCMWQDDKKTPATFLLLPPHAYYPHFPSRHAIIEEHPYHDEDVLWSIWCSIYSIDGNSNLRSNWEVWLGPASDWYHLFNVYLFVRRRLYSAITAFLPGLIIRRRCRHHREWSDLNKYNLPLSFPFLLSKPLQGKIQNVWAKGFERECFCL